MKKYILLGLLLSGYTLAVCAPAANDIFTLVKRSDRAGVQRLLAKKPRLVLETNPKGQTPLLLAVQQKDLDMAYLLIKSSARLTARADKGNALHIAVANQDEPMIKMLLKEAAAKDASLPARLINHQRSLYSPSSLTSEDGNTPLHLAAQRCNKRIYNYLKSLGGDDSLTNAMNKTPAESMENCIKTQAIMAQQKKVRQAKELAAAQAPKDEGI